MALSAIISGGGIGGLATAAALARRGWDVTVYERQDELRAAGSGIYIWENGLRVLEALGCGEQATRGAFRGTHFEQRDNHGAIIESAPIAADKRLLTVPRKQLLAALRDAGLAAGMKVVTRAEVIGASAAGELMLAGGAIAQADLAIGVDGVWSRVRASLGLELLHEQTREGALRTMIAARPDDFDAATRGKYVENWNGMRRLLITPVSEQDTYLALTCPNDDEVGKRIPVDKASWSASFPQWAHLIDRIGPDVGWGVYSVTRCKSWSAGRTAILGDAAHAQPPNLGQGGGMAMQNGLALAVALEGVSDRRDIPDALQAWERRERPLIEECQRWSILYGEVTYLPDEVRSRVIRSAMSDPWVAGAVFQAANSSPTGTSAPGAA